MRYGLGLESFAQWGGGHGEPKAGRAAPHLSEQMSSVSGLGSMSRRRCAE